MLQGIAVTDPVIMRRLFNRFPKAQLQDVMEEWDVMDMESEHEMADFARSSKKALIERTIRTHFLRGFSYQRVGELDLLYTCGRSGKKFMAMQLLTTDGGKPVRSFVDQHRLVKAMSERLRPFCEHHICSRQTKGAIWLRVYFHEGAAGVLTSTNAVFLVYFPHAPYLLVTNTKKHHQVFFGQCIQDTFGCSEVRDLYLYGKTVGALRSLLVDRASQGRFSSYRLGQMDSDPLDRTKKKRRRTEPPKNELEEQIVVEDLEVVKAIATRTHEAFGSNDQPVLEKMHFTLETGLKSDTYRLDEPFSLRVKFEGPSVLEGLKKLGSIGAAKLPLPGFLANVHSAASNSFTIRQATKKPATS